MALLNFMLGVLVLAVAGSIYFLPTMLARKKKNYEAIKVLNLLTGWTIIGWIASLVWSLTED